MRILLISNKVPWPPHDGGAIATLNMCRNLSEEGHSVTLLAMNTSKHRVPEDSLPEWMKHNIYCHTVPVNTRISLFKALANLFFSTYPYHYSRFISKRFQKYLNSILGKNKFDIIQFEGLPLIKYASQIRRKSRARLVLRAHNVEHQIWERLAKETPSIFRKRYYTLLYKRVLNLEKNLTQFDGILYISHEDQKTLQKLGCQQKSQVVWTGFTVPETSEKLEFTPPLKVYYIGALDWRPNQEGLVWFLENIWQQITSRETTNKLYIAGRNATNRLSQKIKRYDVSFKGEVPDAKDFAANKHILIVPLFSGSGIRIKIIEAMGMGKTVITTPLGAEGLPVKHKKDILICETKEEFKQELLSLFSNPEKARELAKEAVKTIRTHFNNKTLTSRVVNFYQHL